jgi:ATP-dependent DNA ligase
MADYLIMKAVEFDKLPVKFKKANPFDSLCRAGYWLQRKYDGCMGIAEMHPEPILCRMLSRTGEDYTASTRHILKELHEALTERHGHEGWTPTIFIGEVWQPVEEAKFPAISGKFRRQSPSPELRFVVNDVLPLTFDTDTPYSARYTNLRSLLSNEEGWKVSVAETHTDWSGALNLALKWQGEGGYDGAILRNPDAGYTVGTVKNGEIIKVKPVMSLDLKCVSWEAGEGKHAGKIGALVVEYNGVRSGVGTGLSDADRDTAVEEFLGKIVEIECLGITEDGKLREPRFKGIRHDKLKAD